MEKQRTEGNRVIKDFISLIYPLVWLNLPNIGL